jgi:hypothetical protein
LIPGLKNENSRAAAAYLLAAQVAAVIRPGEHMTADVPACWPFAPELFKPDLEEPVHCLVMARGFIDREIERLVDIKWAEHAAKSQSDR